MALSSIASSMLAIAATITLLGGPAAAEPLQHCESNIGSPDNLKALKHGLVEGYLPPTSLPNSLELLPLRQQDAPPPTPWMWKQQKPRSSSRNTALGPGSTGCQLEFPCCRIDFFLLLGSSHLQGGNAASLHPASPNAHRCRPGHLPRQKSLPTTSTFHRQQPPHVHT